METPRPAIFRYDLHVHTSERSACAVSPAGEVCRAAAARGLAGIALTDHDARWPAAEADRLRALFPALTILAGAEVSCEDGHFLVFDPGGGLALPFRGGVIDLTREVRAAGGIVIWAHPFRYDPRRPRWLDEALLSGVEVASGNMDGRMGARAAALAREKGVRAFRNSDAHHADDVGSYWNAWERPVPDERALARELGR